MLSIQCGVGPVRRRRRESKFCDTVPDPLGARRVMNFGHSNRELHVASDPDHTNVEAVCRTPQ
jgi:hypothetical protein